MGFASKQMTTGKTPERWTMLSNEKSLLLPKPNSTSDQEPGEASSRWAAKLVSPCSSTWKISQPHVVTATPSWEFWPHMARSCCAQGLQDRNSRYRDKRGNHQELASTNYCRHGSTNHLFTLQV